MVETIRIGKYEFCQLQALRYKTYRFLMPQRNQRDKAVNKPNQERAKVGKTKEQVRLIKLIRLINQKEFDKIDKIEPTYCIVKLIFWSDIRWSPLI